MIGSASRIDFQHNQQNRTLFVVLFSCLAFILFLLFPSLYWLITICCVTVGYAYWLRLQARTPTSGTLLLIHEKRYIELHAQQVHFKGQLMAATIWFDKQVELTLGNERGMKQQVFITRSAVQESDWRLLCRTVLQAQTSG
ncbi:protein YgfX [Pseudoalteromonas piscicida]|uniref:protein YgfX n=1 Tax=Pseudoalteromonas piscicida TaxID=43662 RepID=UPI00309EB04A